MRWMTKAAAYACPVLVSSAVGCVAAASLPGRVGRVVVPLFLVLVAVFASGCGEKVAAAIQARSRPLKPAQATVLRALLTDLCSRGLGPPVVTLRVRPGTVAGAVGFGRRTVILTRGFLDALGTGRLTPDEARVVVARAAGTVRAGAVRADPALALWCLPWTALRAACTELTRPPGGRAFAVTAWRMRWVVGVVAIAQFAAAGQEGFAALVAAMGAATVLAPWAERRWQRELARIGDEAASSADRAGRPSDISDRHEAWLASVVPLRPRAGPAA